MVRKFLPLALVFCALPLQAFAQRATIYDHALSERRVSYDMDVRLDPISKTVSGFERVTWRNPDSVPVDELQFHLYLNAFRSEKSTWMQESGGRHRGFSASEEDRWGGVDITRLRIASDPPLPHGDFVSFDTPTPDTTGLDLTENIEFIRPDNDNLDDFTVISVQLPEPVAPGETIALDIEFESRLPRVIARTGWAEKPNGDPFFMVAQWFPKLGVLEVPGQRYVSPDAPKGEWNTHQFHVNSEFYADFGTYRVRMTVPESYKVGSTGVRVDEQTTDSTKTLTYIAEDVHDFAWTASPAFEVYEDTWKHVDIRVLLQPEHRGFLDRHFESAKTGLEYFDKWIGEYPYTSLTLVDGLGGSNGMEYPTLITCGFISYGMPPWMRGLEMVTIHEFGHQYFYGLLASNEFEEAWLDEGLNSYIEQRIMDTAYGRGSMLDIPGFEMSDSEMQRLSYTKNDPSRGAIFTKSWEYKHGDYSKASYSKPATVLATLEHYLGEDTMLRLMRTYYDTWRFRHPTTRDFIDLAEEVSGEDLDWFFDQYVYGTAAVDYRVDRIRSRRKSMPEPTGGDDTTEVEPERMYTSSVRVERALDGTFPVVLRVTFDDGYVEDLNWDGLDEWKQWEFERPARLTEAYIDPDDKVWLDINRLNNRRSTGSGSSFATKWSAKYLVWVQQVFHMVSGLI